MFLEGPTVLSARSPALTPPFLHGFTTPVRLWRMTRTLVLGIGWAALVGGVVRCGIVAWGASRGDVRPTSSTHRALLIFGSIALIGVLLLLYAVLVMTPGQMVQGQSLSPFPLLVQTPNQKNLACFGVDHVRDVGPP